MTRRFGLPAQCNRSLFWPLAPLFLLMRKTQGSHLRNLTERVFIGSFDSLASRLIPPCDVFIGLSGISTKSARSARRIHQAQIWIERGSRHILSQKSILESLPGALQIPSHTVRREMTDYELADTIVIPSLHVEQSFLEAGVPARKLFRNPFGVDLTMFPSTAAPKDVPPTLLMVGNWSLRKGCDLLTCAWRNLPGVRLIHVGAVSDAPLPTDEGFRHFDPVPQEQLSGFYAQAHVFVLPSREEGLALVQCQALASGLRVVCSDRSGGEDLKAFTDHPERISVVHCDQLEPLIRALKQSLDAAVKEFGARDYLGGAREKLSWKQYGARYAAELTRRTVAGV